MSFLRNAWYVAGFASDLESGPASITIMHERIALYRGDSGRVAAVEDRCPHRFVRLSAGKVQGDNLECGYHGLQFDESGSCVLQPFDDGPVAAHNCVKSYPTTERYGYVWVWMGDAARADVALLPEMPDLEDEQFVFVHGYLPFKGNYQLMADNVLDLSHVDILHASVRCEDGYRTYEKKLVVNGDSLTMYVWKWNTVPSAFQLNSWGTGATRADVHSHMTWFAPCNLILDNGLEEVGAPERSGMLNPAAHFVTPETETTSHYWWSVGRNTRIDDDAMNTLMQTAVQDIFKNEDVFMIEQQQLGMGDTDDYLGQRPVLLEADRAMVKARKILQRLIADERGQPESSVNTPRRTRVMESA
jgi:phenylpropionate dioxygenase-like ring-hydroxylating dioxygenase large terminal subunit